MSGSIQNAEFRMQTMIKGSRVRTAAFCVVGVALLTGLGVTIVGQSRTLLDAAKIGDSRAARALLAKGADPNAVEADGSTVLHWAVENDDTELTNALLTAGARARVANRLGVEPIHLAATNGNATIAQRLIAAGADVNSATPGGETPLMMAARTGDPETLTALLAQGAVVDAREGWRGQTALMWAAVENNAEAIRLLLQAGADVKVMSTAGRFTAFLFAVRGGRLDASRALLDAGADVNERLPDGMSALVLALYNAHYELAAFLLDRGADPDAAAQGWTALHQVVWSRRPNRGFNMPGAIPTGSRAASPRRLRPGPT